MATFPVRAFALLDQGGGPTRLYEWHGSANDQCPAIQLPLTFRW